jgi:hypothetical protein
MAGSGEAVHTDVTTVQAILTAGGRVWEAIFTGVTVLEISQLGTISREAT